MSQGAHYTCEGCGRREEVPGTIEGWITMCVPEISYSFIARSNGTTWGAHLYYPGHGGRLDFCSLACLGKALDKAAEKP
jgi:hypothetical protein